LITYLFKGIGERLLHEFTLTVLDHPLMLALERTLAFEKFCRPTDTGDWFEVQG
jgi:hypothetical protein